MVPLKGDLLTGLAHGKADVDAHGSTSVMSTETGTEALHARSPLLAGMAERLYPVSGDNTGKESAGSSD